MSSTIEAGARPTGADAPEALLPARQADAATASHAARQAGARRGIALMVLAIGFFAVLDAMVKWLGDAYPTMQIVFFRSLFAFIPLGFLIWRSGVMNALRLRDPLGHALRAAAGILAMTGFFYGFANMPLAEAIAITFAAPIFVTALSVPILGEKVGIRRCSAIAVGFVGILVILQPGAGVFDAVAGIVLIATVFHALAMVLVRRLARRETNASIVFSFTLAATLVSAAFLPFHWVTPSLADLALLMGLGLVGGTAQILMTMAFRATDVSLVAPFDYTAIIWATLLGSLIWGEIPGNNIWIGVTIIMASGLYILYREANLGLPRGIARRLHARR